MMHGPECYNTLGFKYAGVQHGSECRCGSSYGRYGASSTCDYKCPGNSSLACGGMWASSIYTYSGRTGLI